MLLVAVSRSPATAANTPLNVLTDVCPGRSGQAPRIGSGVGVQILLRMWISGPLSLFAVGFGPASSELQKKFGQPISECGTKASLLTSLSGWSPTELTARTRRRVLGQRSRLVGTGRDPVVIER